MMKKLLGLLLLSAITYVSAAQATEEFMKSEILKLNRMYDSTASLLAFDVVVRMHSDTLEGFYEDEVERVNYIISDGRIYYSTEEAEYMQNDSFAITAFKDEHVMYISRTRKNASDFLPMSKFSDSALYYYFLFYDGAFATLPTGENEITLTTDSSWAQYKKIVIRYHPAVHQLTSSEFYFRDAASGRHAPVAYDADPRMNVPPLSKVMKMDFENYRGAENDDVFRNTRYIRQDRTRMEYIAVGQYKGYRVLTSGFPNDRNLP